MGSLVLRMILCKVFLYVAVAQVCRSQNTTCSGDLTDYWTSNWKNLKENKQIFFVLSRSTKVVVENYTKSLDFAIEIVAPIIFRPIQNSKIYEIVVSTSNFKSQSLYFFSVFKGRLTLHGLLNQTDLKTYVFQTQDLANESYILLFQTCQVTSDAMDLIQVEKVWIIFVSVPTELQYKRIAESIIMHIKNAGMQDYRFSEFRGMGIKSCEDLRNHFIKCKVENETSVLNIFLVPVFMLLVVVIFVAKSIFCICEIRSNHVHDRSDLSNNLNNY